MAVSERKWDSDTKTWTKNYTPEKTEKSSSSKSSSKSSGSSSKSSKNKSSDDKSSLTSENTNRRTPKGSVEKRVNKKIIRTLEGSLKVLATDSTLKIKVGDTIYLKGLGNFLSGKYYVSEVERTLDGNNGYSQTCTVIKTNFRKTLKVSSSSNSTKNNKVKSSKTNTGTIKPSKTKLKVNKLVSVKTDKIEQGVLTVIDEKPVLQKHHIVDKGETLYSIARKIYGDAARAKDIAQLNGVTDATYTNLSLGQKLLLP